MLGVAQFPTINDSHSHGSWNKRKNPCPLKNHIIPNLAIARAPGTTQPVALWILGPDGCLVRNYLFSHWVWILAIVLFLAVNANLFWLFVRIGAVLLHLLITLLIAIWWRHSCVSDVTFTMPPASRLNTFHHIMGPISLFPPTGVSSHLLTPSQCYITGSSGTELTSASGRYSKTSLGRNGRITSTPRLICIEILWSQSPSEIPL